MNMNEPPALLRNDCKSAGQWLKVKLAGTKSNRSGIGAIVRVVAGGERQTQVLLSQSGYYSHSDSRLHFGLHKAAAADRVEVLWPSGLLEKVENVKANQVLELTEGAAR